jgi:hypothetical protein
MCIYALVLMCMDWKDGLHTLSFSPPKSLRNRIRCQQDTLRYDCYRSAYTMKYLHMDATWGMMMCRSSSGSLRSSKVSLPSACLLLISNLRILYYFPSFLTSHSFPISSTSHSRHPSLPADLPHFPNQTHLTPITDSPSTLPAN